MLDVCLGGLGADPNAEGRKGLEESAEERAVAGNGGSEIFALKKAFLRSPDQARRERGVGKLMLGGRIEAVQVAAAR